MKVYQENYAPIQAQTKHNCTSDNYQFVDSKQVIKQFENKGFQLDSVSSAQVRNPSKEGFQKHIMIFSRPDLILDDGNKVQILARNAHDGSSSLMLNIGVYRAVCANGLVAGNDLFQSRVIHLGDIRKKINDSIVEIAAKTGDLKKQVNLMQSNELDFKDNLNLLQFAADIRLKDIDNLLSVDLNTIDRVRRRDDFGQDLYTVFNRIQESIIRGGIKYRTAKGKNTTCKINSITKNIELNRQLWSKAIELVA